MSNELKPCPFCGGEADIVELDIWLGTGYIVSCRACDGQMADSQDLYRSRDVVAEMWNRRADDADRARLVAQVEELQARVTELESAIVIDRGVFNRLCTLQAIMEHPTATPSAEEFNEYTGLLELVFHRHDKEAADND